jgi:hypothetical protein
MPSPDDMPAPRAPNGDVPTAASPPLKPPMGFAQKAE